MAVKIEYPNHWMVNTKNRRNLWYPKVLILGSPGSPGSRSNALPLRAMRTGPQSGTVHSVFILYLGWLNDNPKCWYLENFGDIFGICHLLKLAFGGCLNAHAIRPYLSSYGQTGWNDWCWLMLIDADWCWLVPLDPRWSKMIQVGLLGSAGQTKPPGFGLLLLEDGTNARRARPTSDLHQRGEPGSCAPHWREASHLDTRPGELT